MDNFKGHFVEFEKELQEKLKRLSESIEINPVDPNLYFDRGYFFYENNEFRNAIKDFTKAIELNFKELYVYYFRGLSYKVIGNNYSGSKSLHLQGDSWQIGQ